MLWQILGYGLHQAKPLNQVILELLYPPFSKTGFFQAIECSPMLYGLSRPIFSILDHGGTMQHKLQSGRSGAGGVQALINGHHLTRWMTVHPCQFGSVHHKIAVVHH
uniref:Uncharacterized protein n=1 Tax=Opuntia streptacantha TaxID=393608 RepID=A0A7C9EMI6_OPUST